MENHDHHEHDIENIIGFIPGYTQNVGRDIGFNKMWMSMREFQNNRTEVLPPIAWNQPMEHWAGFIHNIVRRAKNPTILIAGYSWGCGWGFQQISKFLENWAIDVRCAVLCDPVYRSPLRCMAGRSMINEGDTFCKIPIGYLAPTIKIRKNVKEVWSYYQTENKPRAHRLVALDSKLTDIHPRIQLPYPHQAMDDHPHFHQKVHDVFGQILEDKYKDLPDEPNNN